MRCEVYPSTFLISCRKFIIIPLMCRRTYVCSMSWRMVTLNITVFTLYKVMHASTSQGTYFTNTNVRKAITVNHYCSIALYNVFHIYTVTQDGGILLKNATRLGCNIAELVFTTIMKVATFKRVFLYATMLFSKHFHFIPHFIPHFLEQMCHLYVNRTCKYSRIAPFWTENIRM